MSIKYTPIEQKPAYEIMYRNGYIVSYWPSYIFSDGELKLGEVHNVEYSDYLFN